MSDKAPHVTVDVQLPANTNGAGLARHFGPIVKANTQRLLLVLLVRKAPEGDGYL